MSNKSGTKGFESAPVPSSKTLPSCAQTVIIGGGIVGLSLAYHLTKLGHADVVLLERKQLGCGTTWHAAGLVAQLRATENMTRLARYSQELYAELERETGVATGFQHCGAISLACNKERLEELRRSASMARSFGVEVEEISRSEAQARWPLMQVDDVVGALWIPKDGRTNPIDTSQALARGARRGGAQIFENTEVLELIIDRGTVVGVRTESHEIRAENVVICGGMWSHLWAKQQGINVPLQAAEHYYLITEPMDGMTRDLPVLRDFDHHAYYREETGKLMLGLFEPEAAVWGADGIPKDFCFDELPPDWERMMPWLERAMKRIPALENTGIQLLFNGPESFTPDDRYHLGETPEIKNLYVAAGFNSVGIQSAGGAGKVLADWIHKGHQPIDLWEVNITRMLPFQGTREYLEQRTTETLGLLYEMHWPFRQYKTARNIRRSPLHDRLVDRGACFGELAGWERANWYAPPGISPEYEYSYGRQNWFDYQRQEHLAVRNGVGLFDQSSFSKFRVEGPGALTLLDRVSANNVNVPIGRAVYTQWLNERGTIEADLTITRLAEDAFLIVTAPFTHGHVEAWLRKQQGSEIAIITDLTSGLACINLQGPRSRDFLQSITPCDLSNSALPFSHMADIEIGCAPVKALRITYMGELGYELYIPSEFAVHVYDKLVEMGQLFDLRHCGYHTLQTLRIEKAYREFGHDLGADDTPLQAGLGFAVAWDKPGGFLGREALLAERGQNQERRLVQFRLDDPDPMLYHNEPIWRDGKQVGYLCSGMYGHTLGAAIGLGYVTSGGEAPAWYTEKAYEIEVAGQRYSAQGSLKPLYDPSNTRIKA